LASAFSTCTSELGTVVAVERRILHTTSGAGLLLGVVPADTDTPDGAGQPMRRCIVGCLLGGVLGPSVGAEHHRGRASAAERDGQSKGGGDQVGARVVGYGPADDAAAAVAHGAEVEPALPAWIPAVVATPDGGVAMPGPKYSKQQKETFFDLIDRGGTVRAAGKAVESRDAGRELISRS
jgi:hypothetical protein